MSHTETVDHCLTYAYTNHHTNVSNVSFFFFLFVPIDHASVPHKFSVIVHPMQFLRIKLPKLKKRRLHPLIQPAQEPLDTTSSHLTKNKRG